MDGQGEKIGGGKVTGKRCNGKQGQKEQEIDQRGGFLNVTLAYTEIFERCHIEPPEAKKNKNV